MDKLRLSSETILHNTLLRPERNYYARMLNRHPEHKAFNPNLGREWSRHNRQRYLTISDRTKVASLAHRWGA